MAAPPPRLSICIATLNRAGLLREMLASVASQWLDVLELVVVDGASTDATPDVMAEYRVALGRVTYVRLEAKGGVDQDYHRAVTAATGDYCWLLADDDALEPGAVAAVLAALDRAPSLVIVNAAVRDSELGDVIAPRQLAVETDRVYAPSEHERLFIDTANYLSYIGAVVIDRDLWLARSPERYFGTWFIHVGVIFQAPLPAPAVVLAQPHIRIRAANASWSNRYFEIWMFRWPELIGSFTALSTEARRAVFAPEPWRRPGALLICRAKAAYDRAAYQRWIAPRLQPGPRRWIARLIAEVPGPLVNALAIAYFRLFRPEARTDMLDFRVSRYHWRTITAQPGGVSSKNH